MAARTGLFSHRMASRYASARASLGFFEVAVKFHGADGTKLVDADSYFWLGRYWRAGDWIVRTFCAEAARAQADSIASVRLGLYTIEDRRNERIFHNVNVVDATGTPIGQQIEIALR